MVVLFIYLALSYWAVGKTIYANRILIGTSMAIFNKKMLVGMVLGWILIPVAILKLILGRR